MTEREAIIQKVREAYEKTGLKVCQGRYFSEDGKSCCLAGVVAKVTRTSPNNLSIMQVERFLGVESRNGNWGFGLIDGFDSTKTGRELVPLDAHGEAYAEGFRTGQAVYQAVKNINQKESP